MTETINYDREQKYLFGFLKEFDKFCASNGINYYLADDTLIYGALLGEIQPNPYCAKVFMTADNCQKFISAFSASTPSDRAIEYWGNSNVYPDYTLRYSDLTTTSFNMFDFLNYTHHGFYIEVLILRGYDPDDKDDKNIAQLERYIAMSSFADTPADLDPKTEEEEEFDKKSAKAFKLFASKVKTPTARPNVEVFNHLIANAADPYPMGLGVAGAYSFAMNKGQSPLVSANYFGRGEFCNICGYDFPVPSRVDTFIRKVYGDRINDTGDVLYIKDKPLYRQYCIVDSEVPADAFLGRSGITVQQFKELNDSKRELDSAIKKNEDAADQVDYDWEIVKQTNKRFKFAKYFATKKPIIVAAANAGDDSKLLSLFEPYTEALDSLDDERMVFGFDDDLVEIYIDLLERMGEYELVDRLVSYIPISHKNGGKRFERVKAVDSIDEQEEDEQPTPRRESAHSVFVEPEIPAEVVVDMPKDEAEEDDESSELDFSKLAAKVEKLQADSKSDYVEEEN